MYSSRDSDQLFRREPVVRRAEGAVGLDAAVLLPQVVAILGRKQDQVLAQALPATPAAVAQGPDFHDLAVETGDTVNAELLLSVDGKHLRARITRDALDELDLTVGREVYALVKSVALEGSLGS